MTTDDRQGEYRAICSGRWNGRVLQKDEKTRRPSDKTTKRPEREFNIVMSGQFRTVAMFLDWLVELNDNLLINKLISKTIKNFLCLLLTVICCCQYIFRIIASHFKYNNILTSFVNFLISVSHIWPNLMKFVPPDGEMVEEFQYLIHFQHNSLIYFLTNLSLDLMVRW